MIKRILNYVRERRSVVCLSTLQKTDPVHVAELQRLRDRSPVFRKQIKERGDRIPTLLEIAR